MKVIKLDGRHRLYKEYNMRYALVWPKYNFYCGTYHQWLLERFGSSWGVRYPEWKADTGPKYSHAGREKYYIAVKEESTLTMMFLAIGKVNEHDR